MSAPSWREVARILAERLAWNRCDQHREYEHGCPYCEDERAWDVYGAKAGVGRGEPSGPSTPIHEVQPNAYLGVPTSTERSEQ